MRSYGFIQSPEDRRDVIFGANTAVPGEYFLHDVPPVMDQGQDPTCAAISLYEILHWQESCKGNKPGFSYRSIFDLREDKGMKGMIPREALKSLKKEGVEGYRIKGYARVTSAMDAKAAIQVNGPVMVCFSAYDGDRFWLPSGNPMGGHAVILTGWGSAGFMLQNSWGRTWGNGGTMRLPEEDWKYVVESWTIMI